MIGRLLCRLGLHHKSRISFYYAAWDECDRCGRRWYL